MTPPGRMPRTALAGFGVPECRFNLGLQKVMLQAPNRCLAEERINTGCVRAPQLCLAPHRLILLVPIPSLCSSCSPAVLARNHADVRGTCDSFDIQEEIDRKFSRQDASAAPPRHGR